MNENNKTKSNYIISIMELVSLNMPLELIFKIFFMYSITNSNIRKRMNTGLNRNFLGSWEFCRENRENST